MNILQTHKAYASVSVLLLVLCTSLGARDPIKSDEVELFGTYKLLNHQSVNVSGSRGEVSPYELIVRLYLKNTSNKTLVIPTRNPYAKPRSFHDIGAVFEASAEVFLINFEPEYYKGARLAPSRESYFPVVLKPGEITQLMLHIEKVGADDYPDKMKFVYAVDPELARQFGFWTGGASIELSKNAGD